MAEQQVAEQAAATTEETASPLDNLLKQVDMAPPESAGDTETKAGRLSHALNLFFNALSGQEVERVDKVLVDKVIGEIDAKISAQVNEILHAPEFQKMESAWRGLKFLIDRTNFRKNIKIEVVNCSKESLMEDFEAVPETLQSGLFKHLYDQEYDQAGGEPFGAVLGNYEFENNNEDMSLLRNLSKVSASCHAPFIGSVGASFFGKKDMEELTMMSDTKPIFEQIEYSKWNEFRKSEDSRYVGLTMPRFLLRSPYETGSIYAKKFHFVEDASARPTTTISGATPPSPSAPT